MRGILSALQPGAAVLVSAVAVVSMAGNATVARAGSCTVTATSAALDSEELAFLQLINQYRAQYGAAPLVASVNLDEASAWMARDMGVDGYFDHYDNESPPRSPTDRVKDCGYPGGAGENIAAGGAIDTAAEAFNLWKNSSGHASNMRNASYRMVGIARQWVAGSPWGWYWVTDFGTIDDGTNAAGSSTTLTPKASLISPASGSVLGTTATFTWSAPEGAVQYRLRIGSTPGGTDVFSAKTTATSRTVASLPADGRTLYVRLATQGPDGLWRKRDYAFTASG